MWACGIYFSDQGWDLGPLCWEHRVLATGTAWKFQDWAFPPAFGVVKVEALVAQSCLTLCSPMAYSPPGSFIRRSLQARILEWVAMSFSRGSSHSGDRTWVSCFAGRVFTVRAAREAPWSCELPLKKRGHPPGQRGYVGVGPDHPDIPPRGAVRRPWPRLLPHYSCTEAPTPWPSEKGPAEPCQATRR